jgi:hypothetical protein
MVFEHFSFTPRPKVVMRGLGPGIHALAAKKGVDGRDKPGHDGN